MAETTTGHLVGRVGAEVTAPDLAGNLFPVADELDVADCPVTGRLPDGLLGAFVRNGPNPMFTPIGNYHMFDGDGMLHGVTFDDGRVSYRNRWIRSRGLGAEIAHGDAVYRGLGEVLEFPDPALTGDAGPVKNPANTHIVAHAGRWLALWEGGLPTEVTPDLATVGEYDFGGALAGSMTAHPRLDPRTGEMAFFGYSVLSPSFSYHEVDAEGVLRHSIDLDLPAPVMMHDMVLTEDYAVFLDSPVVFDVANIGKGPLVQWLPENGTRIGVLPRGGAPADTIRWFEIEPGHVQHFWSGWNDGGHVEFWGSRFDAPDFGIGEEGDPRADAAAGRPARFWVDLDAGTAGWEEVDDLPGDFNRINADLDGVEVRHLYMASSLEPGRRLGDFDAVVKYDRATGGRTEWRSGPAGHVGESVFAPDPGGAAEDDGWLLNAVYDAQRDTSDLVVLDARDLTAGPVATVHLPRRVPFGFHANWFPAEG